jgi:nitrate reductase NapE component
MFLRGYCMIKVRKTFVLKKTFVLRKAFVLVVAGLLAPMLAVSAVAAFGFSFPYGSIVAGPGLAAAGPSTFNTYFHDSTMANAGVAADAATNFLGAGGLPGLPVPFGPVPVGIGCIPGIPFGVGPYGTSSAANSLATSNIAEDKTFATSFSTAGGVAAAPGLPAIGAAHFSGNYPEFSLNLF